MEFYEVLESRHSVREFAEKDIDEKQILRILSACMRGPSAGNLQSYKIAVVRSQEKKDELVPAADYQDFIASAPLVVVFFADIARAEQQYGERGDFYATQDATIAGAYCQLAASAEGLSAVWIGDFDSLEISRILDANSYEVPVSILAIGYPKGEVQPHSRRNPTELVREM